jgi:threonine/homoserine/homoserine lactone efflux protein
MNEQTLGFLVVLGACAVVALAILLVALGLTGVAEHLRQAIP